MRKVIWFLWFVTAGFLLPVEGVGQSCSLVTYNNVQFDGGGNILSTNYTSTGTTCGVMSVSAFVKLTMPDGTAQSKWAGGTYSAQAVALTPTATSIASGQGDLSGSNGVSYLCSGFGINFDLPVYIRGATTLLKMIPGTESACFLALGNYYCDYSTVSWCTPETTPPLYNPDGVRAVQKATPNPAYYWVAHAACFSSQSAGPYTCYGFTPFDGGFASVDNFSPMVCSK